MIEYNSICVPISLYNSIEKALDPISLYDKVRGFFYDPYLDIGVSALKTIQTLAAINKLKYQKVVISNNSFRKALNTGIILCIIEVNTEFKSFNDGDSLSLQENRSSTYGLHSVICNSYSSDKGFYFVNYWNNMGSYGSFYICNLNKAKLIKEAWHLSNALNKIVHKG